MKKQITTPEWVRNQVEAIRKHSADDELAHAMEDDLYTALLTSISQGGCEDPAACAAEAIKAQDVVFYRWCA